MSHTRNLPIKVLGLGAGVALTAAALTSTGVAAAGEPEATIRNADAAGAIDDSYLVVLNGDTSTGASARRAVRSTAASLIENAGGGDIGHVYSSALRGFSVETSEAQARRIAAEPGVKYVEQNAISRATETWGLDRIDQKDLPLDDSYTAPNDGSGVTAYVVDTGVDMTHPELKGRVSSGPDFVDGDDDSSDCAGHGTHVAGTIGSPTWGVAKDVDLVAVRVLGCDGTGSNDGIIKAIDWVTANAPEAAVGNMSLGGGQSDAFDEAVENSIAQGVAWAVAAGNAGVDACSVSPAAAPSVLTVAASDEQDSRSIFNNQQSSNYGQCVDLFGPGSNITSTTMGGGTGQMSGTSMATPHVAGALAIEFSANPGESVEDANASVIDNATPDKIDDLRGSPNLLLNVTGLGAASR